MSCLTLTRRVGESISLGSNVTITILGWKGNQVRVKIEAPPEISVDREEIRERKVRDNPLHPLGEVK